MMPPGIGFAAFFSGRKATAEAAFRMGGLGPTTRMS